MKNTIVNELSNSLKSGDKTRIHTLRLILAAIKDKEIASRSNGENDEISSEVVSSLLKKMIKQRNDSIEMFEKANRQELVQKEQEEVKIISEFCLLNLMKTRPLKFVKKQSVNLMPKT